MGNPSGRPRTPHGGDPGPPGLRVLVAAFGDPGHVFPAISLSRALAQRGHEVVIETWEKWREPIEALGIGFTAAEEYRMFFPPEPDTSDGPGAGEAALALLPFIEEMRPDAVVSDVLTLAPALAAERARVPLATLIPHLFQGHEAGLPFFSSGLRYSRTRLGRGLWRAALPMLEAGLRHGRRDLNEQRAEAGLPPQSRLHGGVSAELALVATFPQLEYPRRWPAHVHVTGPMPFELPHPDIELPAGGEKPLVLVAPSTSKDPDNRLVRATLEALADDPVRVVATTNLVVPQEPIEVPGNAVLVDWLSYSQVMPQASLVVCHGGHGTVARALAEGVPVLSSPVAGDMAETGMRLDWAGVGLSVPWRFCRPGPMRWATRRILGDPGFAARADEIAAWSRAHDGPQRGAELVEAFAQHSAKIRT